MFRRILFTLILLSTCSHGQLTPALTKPDHGFLSLGKYTNAFFGFSLSLPNIPNAQPFLPNAPDNAHGVFGLRVPGPKTPSELTVTAKFATVPEDRADVFDLTVKSPTEYELNGRSFFKTANDEKTPDGKLHSLNYVTHLRGYTLTFGVRSYDSKLVRQFEHTIHTIKFFDPATAKDVAGADAQPFPPDAFQPPATRIGSLTLGSLSRNIYLNRELGLSFTFPAGWKVVDQATQKKVFDAGHKAAWGDTPDAHAAQERAEQCSRTLLYVVEPAAGAVSRMSRSSEIITAFDPACLAEAPKFPTSPDDADAIKQVGAAMMQSFSGTPFSPADKVRVLRAQGHLLIEVPGEYSFKLPGESLAFRDNASVVLMELNGYWVTVTFSGRTEARVQELIRAAKIGFLPAR